MPINLALTISCTCFQMCRVNYSLEVSVTVIQHCVIKLYHNQALIMIQCNKCLYTNFQNQRVTLNSWLLSLWIYCVVTGFQLVLRKLSLCSLRSLSMPCCKVKLWNTGTKPDTNTWYLCTHFLVSRALPYFQCLNYTNLYFPMYKILQVQSEGLVVRLMCIHTCTNCSNGYSRTITRTVFVIHPDWASRQLLFSLCLTLYIL